MIQYTRSRLDVARWPWQNQTGPDIAPDAAVEIAFDSITALDREAKSRGMDFIFFLMPTTELRLNPVIARLRRAGVKTIAFMPTPGRPNGVDFDLWWHKEDSHWTVEAVECTARAILHVWRNQPGTHEGQEQGTEGYHAQP